MKNKLMFLIGEGIKRKVNTRTFKIVNLILLLVIPILINIDTIIKFFGGDFDTATEVYINDETNNLYDTFINTFEQTESFTISQTDIEFKKLEESKEDLENDIKEDESKNIILTIKSDEENILTAELTTYDEVDSGLEQRILNTLNTIRMNIAIQQSNISAEELANIYKSVEISKVMLNTEYDEAAENIKTFSYTLIPIFIIPFFLIVIFVIQMIGAEINEEKTSKSMEIIISSVSPKTHFISKMVTVNAFVLLQSILMLIYGAIGLIIRSKINGTGIIESFGINLNQVGEMISTSSLLQEVILALPLIIILLVLSIIAYSLLAGILASMTTSIEDYQQLQTPMMILIMVGYYLALMASGFENATFITVFSIIPFISALLAPVLLIMGQIGITEIIISIVLLIIVIGLFFKYGIRVYKVGILNYSTSKLWTKLFKAMRQKD